ncbi:MAG: sugar ABC transporter permease [Sphaerochaetaceae bacterium]
MIKCLRKYWLEILLIIPMTIYILGFTILPIFQSIVMSFRSEGNMGLTMNNYHMLFNKPQFLESIGNTMFVTVVSLCYQLVLALLIALALKQSFKGRGIVRAIVLMPMGIPTMVSGVMALYVFGTSGYLNEILFRLHLVSTPINWTVGGMRSLFVIVLADTWKVLPTLVLLLLAGLESIPETVYEAAKIDGASSVLTFFHVTLPLLKPSITMSILFRAVDAFRIFELPQILVGSSIPFVATYSYEEYSAGNLAISAASSTVLLVMILLFTWFYMKVIDRGEGFNVT